MGGKLKKYVDRHEKDLAMHRVTIAKMQGEKLDERDPKIQSPRSRSNGNARKNVGKHGSRTQNKPGGRRNRDIKRSDRPGRRRNKPDKRTHELLQRAMLLGNMDVAQKYMS